MLSFKNIFNKFTFITIITFLIYSCGGGSSNNTSTSPVTNNDVNKIKDTLNKGVNDNTGVNQDFNNKLVTKTQNFKTNNLEITAGTNFTTLIGSIVTVLDNDLLSYVDEGFISNIATEENNNDNNYYAYNTSTNKVSVDPIPTKGHHRDYKNKDGNNDIKGTRIINYGNGFKFADKYQTDTFLSRYVLRGSTMVSKFANIIKGQATDYLSREDKSATMQAYCKNYNMTGKSFMADGQDHSHKITYDNLRNRKVNFRGSLLGTNAVSKAVIANRTNAEYNNILTEKGIKVKRDLAVTGTTLMDIAFCGYKNTDIKIISGIDNLTFTPYDTKEDWANSTALNNQKSSVYLNIQKASIYSKEYDYKGGYYKVSLGTKILKINGLLVIPNGAAGTKQLKINARLSGDKDGIIEFSDYKGSKIIAVLNNENLGNYDPNIDYQSKQSSYKFYKFNYDPKKPSDNLITYIEYPLRLFKTYYYGY